MSRLVPRALRLILDLVALATVFVLAFLLRFDWHIPQDMMRHCLFVLPYVVALKYLALYVFDVPKFAWRYIGLREITRILQALAGVALVLLGIRLLASPLGRSIPFFRELIVPIGSLAMDFVLGFCAVVGLRSAWRVLVERQGKIRRAGDANEASPDKRTILVGAGDAGLLVAKEAEAYPDLGILPVGFVDDDLSKAGTMVHGIPVLGTSSQLVSICEKLKADQVLVTMAEAPGKKIREIMRLCDEVGLAVKIIPGIHELVDGHLDLHRLRNVAIEDLLRREPVRLDETLIGGEIGGKVVLVTGAGGSIGSELARQLCRFPISKLVLVEQAENALFEIHRELSEKFPEVSLAPVIGDITDRARMEVVFQLHRPKVVLHAAAHKHVPMMEWNPGEAVKNNVFGTKCIADLSGQVGVERFVMISTDKAVNPTSIMGATKRVAELYIQSLAQDPKTTTRYVAVRFGNVLGSAGSVIPIFRDQIAKGGPVRVTHPEMRRYFMTIPEASQLVIQAATMGKGGEIFILDMGDPVYIVDLAEDLIRLSGLKPGEDIEIQFTGMRPGEKLFEELSVADESAEKTFHPKIFVGKLPPLSPDLLLPKLRSLANRAEDGTLSSVRRLIQEVVPEFSPEDLSLSQRPPPEDEARLERISISSTRASLEPSLESVPQA